MSGDPDAMKAFDSTLAHLVMASSEAAWLTLVWAAESAFLASSAETTTAQAARATAATDLSSR